MPSADCNPEAAVMVGDLLLSYDASVRGYYGVKGVDWTMPMKARWASTACPHCTKPWCPGRKWSRRTSMLVADHLHVRQHLPPGRDLPDR